MVLSAEYLFFFFFVKNIYIYLNSFIEMQFVYCTSHAFEVYNSMAVIVGASEL